MADKRIEISIATSGGDKAAADIKKVADAADAGSRGFGGMLDSTPEKAEKTTEKVRDLNEELGEMIGKIEAVGEGAEGAGEKLDDAGEAAAKTDENIEKIARAQKAQAIAQIAEQAGHLASKFRDAADEVQDLDAEAAVALRRTADRLEGVASSVTTVASAFAVGGPLGSALAALGVFVGALTDRFRANEVAALRAAAATKRGMEEATQATREAVTAAEERSNALANASVIAQLELQKSKVAEVTSELRDQLQLTREQRRLENEVLDARDQQDLAEVDAQESGGSISPSRAATERAYIEAAARERQRNERKQQAMEDAKAASEEAAIKIEAAEKAAAAAERQAEKAAQSERSATGLAEYADSERKKIIPDGETGQISESDKAFVADIEQELKRATEIMMQDAAAMRSARELADAAAKDASDANSRSSQLTSKAGMTASAMDRIGESDVTTQSYRAIARANEEKRRAEAEAERKEREEERRERESRSIMNEEARIGRDAVGMLPPGVSEQFQRSITKISNKLTNGDQGGEIKDLMNLMDKLASSVESNRRFDDSRYQQLRQRVENIAGWHKNSGRRDYFGR